MCFFFQAEDGMRYLVRSRGLGDVYKRQSHVCVFDPDRAVRAETVGRVVDRPVHAVAGHIDHGLPDAFVQRPPPHQIGVGRFCSAGENQTEHRHKRSPTNQCSPHDTPPSHTNAAQAIRPHVGTRVPPHRLCRFDHCRPFNRQTSSWNADKSALTSGVSPPFPGRGACDMRRGSATGLSMVQSRRNRMFHPALPLDTTSLRGGTGEWRATGVEMTRKPPSTPFFPPHRAHKPGNLTHYRIMPLPKQALYSPILPDSKIPAPAPPGDT